MIIVKKAFLLKEALKKQREKGLKIGFVPTMGALHQGHLSLVDQACRESGFVVCSIFVNPTQFNDKKDFEKYPVTLEKDISMLASGGCNLLFLPAADEVYPAGTENLPNYDLGYLETVLEGKYRPGHFQGVCQVVERLLNLTEPDLLFLGQKDYQQCMVINRMMELRGMVNPRVLICPTLREADGLAMSSRNMRLNGEQKKKASLIFEVLQRLKTELRPGGLEELKLEAVNKLGENGFVTDYIEIAYASSLELVSNWDGYEKIVALAAAYLGEVRLIDNILLN